jgi:BirA family biotin operon repressor/biotin-[acetyl-CoA-carboxylase] ligase
MLPVTIDRGGRPFRHFPVAVSVGAMALAWARQEAAPHGATVLTDHEINALGRLGYEWQAGAAETLACAVVLRPTLDVEDADIPWLLGGLATAVGIEAATGIRPATWWPDLVVDPATSRPLVAVLSEAQLAPGRVRAAVVSLRIDMGAIGVPREGRDALLTSVLNALDDACDRLAEDPVGVIAAYQSRCALVGRRIKVRLRPHGETRGEVSGVDVHGRLQLTSSTGMVERITVDMLRSLELA